MSEFSLHDGGGRRAHPLVEFSLDETRGDAADGVAVAADLWLTDGQSGGFSRQSGLQVEVDGALVVALALLHLPGLLVLTRLRQPAVVVPPQVFQLRVALQSFQHSRLGRVRGFKGPTFCCFSNLNFPSWTSSGAASLD